MAKTPLRIATSARTPLFTPIYVLRRYQGFQLQRDHLVTTSAPEGDENGDTWAARQLIDGSAEFAVCDPTIAEENRSVRVVATIVGRMAFWAVARQDIRYFEEFANFKRLISYPVGMTGYFVAEMIRKRIQKKHKKKLSVVPTERDKELSELVGSKVPSVALTTNLLLAQRFIEEHPEFKISPLWTLDPAFSSFMLTGLLVRQADVDRKYALVANVVRSVHRAVALVITNEDEAVQGLQDEYETLKMDEARHFVRTINESWLYPTALTPELTSWNNVRAVHIEGSNARNKSTWIKTDMPSTRTFVDSVSSGIALDADRLGLSLAVRFGKGDLYEDVFNKVDTENRVSLQNATVVGYYRRFKNEPRDFLIEKVERMKQALMISSKKDENYLIWGGSGSGKSYLIEELGRTLELAGACQFINIDLAGFSRSEVEEAITRVENASKPVLCLLDEIDGTAEFTLNYNFLFPKLRLRRKKNKQIVFVLVGSTTSSVKELAEKIRAPEREKGKDLMRSVPDKQWFDVPDFSTWDRLIIFINGVALSLQSRGSKLVAVEKLALYYVAVSRSEDSAAVLTRFGEDAANRMSPTADRLRYDDLFDESIGEQERFDFYSQHSSTAPRLTGKFVQIDD